MPLPAFNLSLWSRCSGLPDHFMNVGHVPMKPACTSSTVRQVYTYQEWYFEHHDLLQARLAVSSVDMLPFAHATAALENYFYTDAEDYLPQPTGTSRSARHAQAVAAALYGT